VTTQNVERTEARTSSGKRSGVGSRKPADACLLTPYLFMAPYLVLFGIFIVFPVFYGIWISLHNWDYLLPGKPWVGLQNYADLFTPGSVTFEPFWQSMEATGKFTLYSVPLLVVIPLLIALILNERFPGRNFFRTLYFAPFVLGVAVVGILWRYLLDANVGLVNYYLGLLGLPDDIPWTNELPWAWVALVGATVWWTLGFNAVIYLAGLQDIDPALYDAAKVDGANRWRRFLHVTLPGLRPILLFVIIVTILASANMFGQAYLITEGAPGDETKPAIWYIAEEGLQNFKMGSAAAMSYVLALFLAVISVANFALFRYRED
jgi:multiple sugar transport system permease protein